MRLVRYLDHRSPRLGIVEKDAVLDPIDVRVTGHVDIDLRQDGRTSQVTSPDCEQLAYVPAFSRLCSDDVVVRTA